ncbi:MULTISPECIES: DUF5597 domain-containing protein [unclassified Enterococcus]|jgi:hypothetical protein|uniref:DUF5597 domain-containing protein n=1 Tax=unclassified Enterococcus TaxID=2608891 RepID=UPI003D2B256C
MAVSYKIQKKENRYYFLENNQPKLLLGGEIHNSSASTAVSMEKNVWPFVKDIGLNTLLIPLYWEAVEKKPGEFSFDLIDHHLERAKTYNIKVVFLWFGLWKNGLSTYVPSWVKVNSKKYFRVINEENKAINCISPFCEEAVEADCRALAEVGRYLNNHPLKDQLCMMQIQNEVGCLTARDHSPSAQKAYTQELPVKIRELYPNAAKWNELPDEAFMANAFSCAIDKMAATVKKQIDIPLFTNAWLQKEGKKAGQYPSGGPTKHVLEIWQANAEHLVAFAPDIYEENYQEIVGDYQKIDQPLLIPETRKDLKYMSNIFYAFGENALLYSPFGIEDLAKSEAMVVDEDQEFLKQLGLDQAAFDPTGSLPYLKRCYQLMAALEPIICEEKIALIPFKKEKDAFFAFKDQTYNLTVKFLSKEGTDQLNSAGFFFKKENEYYFIGSNIAIFHEALDKSKKSEILNLEEGTFIEGKWLTERVLNGDERYTPYIGNMPKIIKFSLYTY